MEKTIPIQFYKGRSVDIKKWAWQGLSQHALDKRGTDGGLEEFAFYIEENNQYVAVLTAKFFFGSINIDMLYVAPEKQKRGLGSQLLEKAFSFAIENNCLFCTLETMDFQALDFYKKHGFSIEFAQLGYENNSTYYFLRKELVSDTKNR